MSDTVLIEKVDDVIILTLNAPKTRNAFSTEMRTALREELRTIADDPLVRAVVLTGAGGHFCSGGDIGEMVSVSVDRDHAIERLSILQDCIRLIFSGPKPVVAAVEGAAAGAGLAFAAACDHVVAAADARFAASFVHVGLAADCGLQLTLSQRIGPARARRMILGGEVVDARSASAIGLADSVAEPGRARTDATAIALSLAKLAPLSVAATKAAFAHRMGSLESVLALETECFARLGASLDHEEAKAAFASRRSPEFGGH